MCWARLGNDASHLKTSSVGHTDSFCECVREVTYSNEDDYACALLDLQPLQRRGRQSPGLQESR